MKKSVNQNEHVLQTRAELYLKYFWGASQGGESLPR